MADRVLRGSRLGAVSYESDRNHELAPRQLGNTSAQRGTSSRCRSPLMPRFPSPGSASSTAASRLVDGNEPEQKKAKPPRTHWDMLLERRSVEELEELLKEHLDIIKARRRGN